jgi:hypothetical protein
MMTTTRRLIAPLAVVALFVASLFFAASASAYSNPNAAASCSDTVDTPGETISCTVTGFQPNTSGTVTLHSAPVQVGTFTTDAQGTATMSVNIPGDTQFGQHELWFDDPLTAKDPDAIVSITVNASGTLGNGSGNGNGGGLAGTGVAVVGIGALGVVLLVGGGLMLLAGRRRKVSA